MELSDDEFEADVLKFVRTQRRIAKAIEAIKALDSAYWQKTLEQRLAGGAGSKVNGFDSPEALEEALQANVWWELSHPALAPGCCAFCTTNIWGEIGIVDLDRLPADMQVILDDRKATGKLSCLVKDLPYQRADQTVIILGMEEGREVVFTFHPGLPVAPSEVPSGDLHGKTVSVAEALKMGLRHAKIVE